MPELYYFDDITPNEPSITGHVVYPKAIYNPDGRYIVYKENKHQQKELTQFEMAFAALARLLIDSNLTPKQHFVVDENQEVKGLVCEHLCYMIGAHEKVESNSPKQFYVLKSHWNIDKQEKLVNQPEDIECYFLNKLEPGFFAWLRAEDKRGHLSIDMTSLASLLTSSYLLEEDDLHKGNFGCYFIEKEEKPHAVFFKIDHDMMFADALMSFGHGRVNHCWRYDAEFNITARDLMSFPLLSNSGNHYWPTSFSILSKPFDRKVYRNFSDRSAFRQLAEDENFKKAKWRSFLKQILIPPALVRETLNQTLDKTKPDEQAKINMIVQAFAARQSRLRTELFTVKPFIEFVNGFQDIQKMKDEITIDITGEQKTDYQYSISVEFLKYRDKYQSGQDLRDTPLHVAIRLGDFRYYDKWNVYSAYLNVANRAGQTPLDLALTMIKDSTSEDVRSDAKYIVKYLLYRGAISATQTPSQYKDTYAEYIDYKFNPGEYKQKAVEIKSFDDLKALMQAIDQDFRFSLRLKKQLSFFCLELYISKNKNQDGWAEVLRQFKTGLNGDRKQNFVPLPELQFIRQLRSRLWIVRRFRGLIGGTSTQIAMNKVIDRELKRVEPKSPGCLSFFNCFKTHSRSVDQTESTRPINAAQ